MQNGRKKWHLPQHQFSPIVSLFCISIRLVKTSICKSNDNNKICVSHHRIHCISSPYDLMPVADVVTHRYHAVTLRLSTLCQPTTAPRSSPLYGSMRKPASSCFTFYFLHHLLWMNNGMIQPQSYCHVSSHLLRRHLATLWLHLDMCFCHEVYYWACTGISGDISLRWKLTLTLLEHQRHGRDNVNVVDWKVNIIVPSAASLHNRQGEIFGSGLSS